MNFRLALLAVAFLAASAPAAAQDVPMSALAPADEYFGHARLSVLGIANTIRDVGKRIEEGGNPRALIDGPLWFASDAIASWERAYPKDPWIAKDLLGLEVVYALIPTAQGRELVSRTEAWLVRDYPDAPAALEGRRVLADALGEGNGSSTDEAWSRFAALRAPLPPH
ncbi:MAG TPA: hypothetical protein VE591_08445 [Candidatus Acidoferrum sp.]|nr:hypothetical protein [Candidatus Acidoferrum sp.]